MVNSAYLVQGKATIYGPDATRQLTPSLTLEHSFTRLISKMPFKSSSAEQRQNQAFAATVPVSGMSPY